MPLSLPKNCVRETGVIDNARHRESADHCRHDNQGTLSGCIRADIGELARYDVDELGETFRCRITCAAVASGCLSAESGQWAPLRRIISVSL